MQGNNCIQENWENLEQDLTIPFKEVTTTK